MLQEEVQSCGSVMLQKCWARVWNVEKRQVPQMTLFPCPCACCSFLLSRPGSQRKDGFVAANWNFGELFYFIFFLAGCLAPRKTPFSKLLNVTPWDKFFLGESQSWNEYGDCFPSPWEGCGMVPSHLLLVLCLVSAARGAEAASHEHPDLSQPIIPWRRGSHLRRRLYKHICAEVMLLPGFCQKQLFYWISSLCCQRSGHTLCGLNEVPC